jgi:hypothetical protein
MLLATLWDTHDILGMSSTDLNAVVAHSDSPGVGTLEKERGVPDEELGYLASDQYTKALSRSHSPVTTRDEGKASPEKSENGYEDTDEHGNVIHLDEPTQGIGYLRRGNSDHTASRSPSRHGGSIEGEEEREEYSILAQDEVLKRQMGQYRQAAVYTPTCVPKSRLQSSALEQQRDGSEKSSSTLELVTTGNESRDSLRTPYEELSPADENAKPLFPDSDGENDEVPKNAHVENLKRPGLSEHRFPSNDVWEEAPEYAQLEATVERSTRVVDQIEGDDEEGIAQGRRSTGPELEYVHGQPNENYEPGDELEFERKQKEAAPKSSDYHLNLQDLPEDERLSRLLRTTHTESGSEKKQSVSRRKFPSNDIWEDVPPSLDLQEEIEPDQRPEKDRATTGDIQEHSGRPTTVAGAGTTTRPAIPARPNMPARPQRKPASVPEKHETSPEATSKEALSSVLDKPKPSAPTRPAKSGFLARTPSEEKQQPPEPKPKPGNIPRTGGKIAALKAGFLGDLESRLRLGPTAPKKEEKKEEEEAKKEEPLVDVRKSRARGPRGRKPPTKEEKTETAEAVTGISQTPVNIDLAGVWTVFTLDTDLDVVLVNTTSERPEFSAEISEVEQSKATEKGSRPATTPTHEDAPAATTRSLPSTDGASTQRTMPDPQIHAEGQPEATFPADKDSNPTLIPDGEHPEDAFVPSIPEVGGGAKITGLSTAGSLVDGHNARPEGIDQDGLTEKLAKEA